MKTSIVWFRQDLRLTDNPALYSACNSSECVLFVYILDDTLYPLGSAQRWWLHHSLSSLQDDLSKYDQQLILKRGDPSQILLNLIQDFQVSSIYWNRCYEPKIIKRDTELKNNFQKNGIKVESFNGNLLNEPWQIKNQQDSYYKVFTHYWKACNAQQKIRPLFAIPKFKHTEQAKSPLNSAKITSDDLHTWNLLPKAPDWSTGFKEYWIPGENHAKKQLKKFITNNLENYATLRDFPGHPSNSRLSPHIHFGEISPWQIYHAVKQHEMSNSSLTRSTERFLAEIGWREFSYYLLYHYPELPTKNFKSQFDNFAWLNDKTRLKAWQKGKTGYPIVDAGMRELWHTGYMHNRVRMIVASFLTKDLLIDWRVGADWFWDTLLDADLANNSASWQWVAGSGADASPYFRIFNPNLQGEKFDANGDYVRHWVPELNKLPKQYIHKPWLAPEKILYDAGILLGKNYPLPIVDHDIARQKALQLYREL